MIPAPVIVNRVKGRIDQRVPDFQYRDNSVQVGTKLHVPHDQKDFRYAGNTLQWQIAERQSRHRPDQIGFGRVDRCHTECAEFVAESRKNMPEPLAVRGQSLEPSRPSINKRRTRRRLTASKSLWQASSRIPSVVGCHRTST